MTVSVLAPTSKLARCGVLAGVVAILAATTACSDMPSSHDMDPVSSLRPTAHATTSWRAERAAELGEGLRTIVAEQRFAEVVHLASGRRSPQAPNVDVAVIELDASGRPAAAADVLLDKDHPRGVAVPVDAELGVSAVRWRRWDSDRWSAGRRGVVDVAPGRTAAATEFMAPYPASVFKLLVAFGVLHLVDRGAVRLDGRYRYVSGNGGCPGGANASATRTNREWLDGMITYSDNRSTCALVQQLHRHDAVDGLNAAFLGLGLGTLQLRGTDPVSGGRWTPQITMTALDTAKLLLVVSGAPGVLWRTPRHVEVRADHVLSARSRQVFLDLLADQGLNYQLSTANWCGLPYPAAGLPQRIAPRWIDRKDGTVTVHGRVYGQDVRTCNARAEVTFAHKTGLTEDAAGDAGIVTSLPGASARRYIVVMFSTLGSRYGDPATARVRGGRARGVTCTERIAVLGRRIDMLMTGAP